MQERPHNPAEYNTPATTPSPAAPSTPGREINPPPSQYPKPQPVAHKGPNTPPPPTKANIDDVADASEDSFPASDPPSSHRTA